MENCVAFFVYIDHIVKLKISLKHLLIIFELTLDTIINKNPFLIVALGDFNAKKTNCYETDIQSYEDLKIDTITSKFGLQ